MLVATILGRALRNINAITGANRSQESRGATSVVAVNAFHAFVLFLSMQAE